MCYSFSYLSSLKGESIDQNKDGETQIIMLKQLPTN
jgi:hypothetical protein